MANIKPFVGAPDRRLFERQPDEPQKAWQAFLLYREIGWDRTIQKAADLYRERNGLKGKSRTAARNLEDWAAKWGWTVRAAEWDRELDKHRRALALKEIEKMHERHANLGKMLQSLGAIELKKFLKDAEKKVAAGTISIADVYKAIETGAKLERSSRGEPESIVEERHKLNADEERSALRGLLTDPESLALVDELMRRSNGDSSSDAE